MNQSVLQGISRNRILSAKQKKTANSQKILKKVYGAQSICAVASSEISRRLGTGLVDWLPPYWPSYIH